jgi:glycine/D-amino acid oxidase-like deaminating enzyme
MAGESAAAARNYAVIGAGVLGVCLAARLAQAGAAVTLLDQAEPGHGATRSSFAWLNSNDKAPRAYHDLNHAGMRAWAELAASLGDAGWYRPAGNLEWATDPAGQARLAARVDRLARWGYPAELIDAAAAAELEPALRLPSPPPGVAWFPGEGYLLTEAMVSELVAVAVRHAATVLTGPAGQVTGFDVAGGVICGVRTAAGQLIAADTVVCCAGRWVPELTRLAGSASPVPLVPWAGPGDTAPGLVGQAGPVTGPGLVRMVHAPGISLRPHTAGQVHMEAPDAAVDLHTPEPELRRWAAELLRRARRVIPGLTQAQVTGYRACVRPMPADGQSIVGWLPGTAGLYLAVTHSGVTLGAHLAQLITEELGTGAPPAGLAPYRPSRFPAGARVTGTP